MFLTGVLFVYFQCRLVTAMQYAKPVPKTLWPERCASGERVINDCNWCHCNQHFSFTCTARICDGVDLFGHFNDAISNYEVGMEGHGVWRSDGGRQSACQPRMHYQREGLLCICDDTGNWPSPVCRDLFQVMHEVELTGHDRPSALHRCERGKLYLYGCNVCFCTDAGRIDPAVCTKNNCSDDDPIMQNNTQIASSQKLFDESEVYAECELDRKYILGCRKCVCLKNNRLLCDNCEKDYNVVSRSTNTKDDVVLRSASIKDNSDYCSLNPVAELFTIDCNTCVCDTKGVMYCTTKKCLTDQYSPKLDLTTSADLTLRTVDPPIDSSYCIPGTKYKVDCNTCFCTIKNGVKSLSCTLMYCDSAKALKAQTVENSREKGNSFKSLTGECVQNTVYESNCLLCRCDVIDGVKRESCLTESHCTNNHRFKTKTFDLNDSHGYCEPAHIYKRDCNTCKCLSDGKTAACSSRVCRPPAPPPSPPHLERPVSVDIVPVSQHGGVPCPSNHMYRVDCNFCFCLSNGNVLCTTADCGDSKK